MTFPHQNDNALPETDALDGPVPVSAAPVSAAGHPAPQPPANVVGVGPWRGELPVGDHWDPELLAEGDTRNVVDEYRYWTHDAIVADLDAKRHSFHVAIENWQHDLNIGSVVRCANAFLAKEVHIIGRRRWNRRGAMVTDKYQHVRHHPTVADFTAWAAAEGLAVIGIDNFPDSVPLETYDLPRNCVLVFGQEGPGLTDEVHAAAQATLSIAQFGSTRSINASAAAAIAMHAWIRRHVFAQPVR
ncbi:MAG: rRNA methyltransferase [Micrococcaceae bacterium]|nr:rRNA methyltransferase [Micrococcaceae bacterium]